MYYILAFNILPFLLMDDVVEAAALVGIIWIGLLAKLIWDSTRPVNPPRFLSKEERADLEEQRRFQQQTQYRATRDPKTGWATKGLKPRNPQ